MASSHAETGRLEHGRITRPFRQRYERPPAVRCVTSYLDDLQELLGFGPRTRTRFLGRLQAFAGASVEDFGLDLAQPIPTLVVHDRDDRKIPFSPAARFVERTPGAELVATEGLGHFRILVDPTLVDAVAAFLGTEDATRRLPRDP